MAKLRSFKPGNFYCYLYTDNGPDTFLFSFIQQGLDKKEKVIYYGYDPFNDHLVKEMIFPEPLLILRPIHKNLQEELANEILGADGYLKRIIVNYSNTTDRHGEENSPVNVNLEAIRYTMNNRCTALFSYDLNRLSPDAMLSIFAIFPSFVIDGEIYENVFCRVVPDNPRKEVLKAEDILDHLRDYKKLKEEIKKGDEALRASEHNYLSIFESAANLIATVDKKGNIVDCNGKIKQVLGYDRDEIIGKSIADIFHPDQLHRTSEIFKEIIKKGASYNKQYKMITKDGSCIFVNINSTPLKDEKGKITKVIAILEDITERRRAEEALFQSEKKYRELIDMLPDAIVSLSQGIIIYANKATYNILGLLHPRELIGHAMQEFLDHAGAGHLKKYLENNCPHEPDPGPVKVKTRKPDGTFVFVEWTSISANCTGGHMALLMGRDITEKQIAENLIRESEERLKSITEHSKKLERQVENFGKLFT